VVYRGPSAFDGKQIVAVVTGCSGNSVNVKTGPLAHLWILRADQRPLGAQRTGADVSVCGDCALRPFTALEGAVKCYVNTWQAAKSVWSQAEAKPIDLQGAVATIRRNGVGLRLGAYGDPAALPEAVIHALASAAAHVTGYTHAWRKPMAAWLKSLAMASVDNSTERDEAQAAGWRTFRVVRRLEVANLERETWCAATTHDTTCNVCRACGGKGKQKSVAIVQH
jgi:hypothetical protein